MVTQNRQNDRNRVQAMKDFKTNIKAKKEIEELDKILEILNKNETL